MFKSILLLGILCSTVSSATAGNPVKATFVNKTDKNITISYDSVNSTCWYPKDLSKSILVPPGGTSSQQKTEVDNSGCCWGGNIWCKEHLRSILSLVFYIDPFNTLTCKYIENSGNFGEMECSGTGSALYEVDMSYSTETRVTYNTVTARFTVKPIKMMTSPKNQRQFNRSNPVKKPQMQQKH